MSKTTLFTVVLTDDEVNLLCRLLDAETNRSTTPAVQNACCDIFTKLEGAPEHEPRTEPVNLDAVVVGLKHLIRTVQHAKIDGRKLSVPSADALDAVMRYYRRFVDTL